jgi:hypothetical protein
VRIGQRAYAVVMVEEEEDPFRFVALHISAPWRHPQKHGPKALKDVRLYI